MNTPDEDEFEKRRPTLQHYLMWTCILLAIPLVVFFRTCGDSAPPNPVAHGGPLSPLGTNELKIGANLYAPINGFHFGKVIALDSWYDFPDRTNRPGALLRMTNGVETWVPRENMAKMLVAQ